MVHATNGAPVFPPPVGEGAACQMQQLNMQTSMQHIAETQSKIALLQQQAGRTRQLLNDTVRDQTVLIEALAAENQIARWTWRGPVPIKNLTMQVQEDRGTASNPQGAHKLRCLVRIAPETRIPATGAQCEPPPQDEEERVQVVEDENAHPKSSVANCRRRLAVSKPRDLKQQQAHLPTHPAVHAQSVLLWDREETNNCSQVFSWVSGGGSIQLKVGGLFELQLLLWLCSPRLAPTELPDLCLLLNGCVIGRRSPQGIRQAGSGATTADSDNGSPAAGSPWTAIAGTCTALLHTVAALPSAPNLETAWEFPLDMRQRPKAEGNTAGSVGGSEGDRKLLAAAVLTARLLPFSIPPS